nr:hypothetical protein Itr_chr01CG13190 [Ipomoea trifida]
MSLVEPGDVQGARKLGIAYLSEHFEIQYPQMECLSEQNNRQEYVATFGMPHLAAVVATQEASIVGLNLAEIFGRRL